MISLLTNLQLEENFLEVLLAIIWYLETPACRSDTSALIASFVVARKIVARTQYLTNGQVNPLAGFPRGEPHLYGFSHAMIIGRI